MQKFENENTCEVVRSHGNSENERLDGLGRVTVRLLLLLQQQNHDSNMICLIFSFYLFLLLIKLEITNPISPARNFMPTGLK